MKWRIFIDSFIKFSFYVWRLPFNWKNPIGSGVAFVFELVSFLAISQVLLITICLLVGFTSILMSFSQNIQWKFRDLYENFKIHRNIAIEFCELIGLQSEAKELSKSHSYWTNIELDSFSCFNINEIFIFSIWDFNWVLIELEFNASMFTEGIQFMYFRFSLVTEFSDIFEYNITFYYIWNMISICDSLLMFHVIIAFDDFWTLLSNLKFESICVFQNW